MAEHTTRRAKTSPAPSAARTTRGRKPAKAPPKKPAAAPTELDSLREALAAVRQELEDARREVGEAVTACREAEARAATARADVDAVRRVVAEVDASAAAVRGTAEAAQAEARRAHDQSEQAERRMAKLREWMAETRAEFAALDAEARRTIDAFRTAVDELRATSKGELYTTSAAELPEVPELPPEDRAGDVGERLARLLNDAWAVEKEQAGLLQTLADESGDREVGALLEEHRAAAQQRQEAVEARLGALGTKPSGGRGLLGQLVTRIWEAVQAPRDQADKAVLSVLKALAAAEFLAGLYAAAHAAARAAGGPQTAEFAAAQFRDVRGRADALRAALAPTVGRMTHR